MGGPGSQVESSIKDGLADSSPSVRLDAVGEIHIHYMDQITGWLKANSGMQSTDLADAWQELICSLVIRVALSPICVSGSLDAYLRVAARNKAITVLRRNAARPINVDPHLLPDAIDRGDEDTVLDHVTWQHILNCFDKLPISKQTILLEYYRLAIDSHRLNIESRKLMEVLYPGMEPPTDDAFRSQLYRAHAAFRALLKNGGDDA